MNARETMQALLDGKIVTTSTCEWKLNDTGALIFKDIEGWAVSNNVLNRITGVIEEYPLTFEEALRAMLDGKVVKCKSTISSRRFHDGEFQFLDCIGEWIQANWFENELQKGKWKVVE